MMKRSVCALLAVAGLAGSVQAQVMSWASVADGLWGDAANWSPMNVPDLAGESAVLGLAGLYTVTLNVNPTIDSLQLLNPDAVLNVSTNLTLSVGATGVSNNGLIVVNNLSSGFNSRLSFFEGGTLDGTGIVELRQGTSDSFDARVSQTGLVPLTHGQSHTIMGSGIIDGLVNNDGLILANDPAQSLEVRGTISQGLTGVLRGDGAVLGMRDVVITGGLIEGINTGAAATVGNGTVLSSVQLQGQIKVSTNNTMSVANPGIANAGTITINPDASGFNSFLNFDSDATIAGGGDILLIQGTSDNFDATISTTLGVVGTIGQNQLVHGSGLMTGDFVNNGNITADDALHSLDLVGTISQAPGGVIGADAATLALQNVTISGGMMGTLNSGMVEVNHATTATIQSVTNVGAAGVRDSGVMAVGTGGLTNNGTVTVNTTGSGFNSSLRFDADATIDGTGSVVLNQTSSDSFDAILSTNTGITGTIGSGQVISGRGRVDGTFVHNGLILADQLDLSIHVFGSVDQSAGGTMQGDTGAVALGNVTVTGGTFDGINGGRVEVSHAATATIQSVTNVGAAGVRGTGTMKIDAGGMTNNGTVTVNLTGDGWNSGLGFSADATIDGTGSIVLNQQLGDSFDARIFTDAGIVGTNGAGHTIMGRGRMDGDFVNIGTILGNIATGDLVMTGTVDQTLGGTMRGDAGAVALGNVTVTGGTFDGINGGRVEVAHGGTATIQSVTNVGAAGVRGTGTMKIGIGGMTNNGSVTVNLAGDGWNSGLGFSANATIDGTGSIILNQQLGDSFDSRIFTDVGVVGTNGASHTIMGRGRMDGDFVNIGTILGNIPATDLVITGTVDQTPGGTMRGDGGFVGLGNGTYTGGFFDGINSGQVDIVWGGEAFVSGTTMTGTNGIRGNGTMALTGDITNNGDLIINTLGDGWNANLRFDANTTIGGTGSVSLNQVGSDSNDAFISTAVDMTGTFGPDITLAGHGKLTGSFISQGTIAPGNIAGSSSSNIHVLGSMLMEPTSQYAVEIGGLLVSEFDRITGTADITLDGALNISLFNGFVPGQCDSFTIISANSITGTFSSVISPSIGPDFKFRVVYNNNQVQLVAACKGDLNADCAIDVLDFFEFVSLFAANDPEADINGDGFIDVLDFFAFVVRFNNGC